MGPAGHCVTWVAKGIAKPKKNKFGLANYGQSWSYEGHWTHRWDCVCLKLLTAPWQYVSFIFQQVCWLVQKFPALPTKKAMFEEGIGPSLVAVFARVALSISLLALPAGHCVTWVANRRDKI